VKEVSAHIIERYFFTTFMKLFRLSTHMVKLFVKLEQSIAYDASDNESGEESEERHILVNDHLEKARHHAYLSPMLSLLEKVLELPPQKFMRNKNWITPLVSSLITCSDPLLRQRLQQIYSQHINPFLIEYK